MSKFDLAPNLKPVQVFGPAVLSADQTAVDIDLQGFHAAAVFISVGDDGVTFDGSNYVDFRLLDSDDNASYEDVDLEDLTGPDKPASVGTGGIVATYNEAHASPTVKNIGYIGGKRYLRVDIEFTGTHGTGTPISVVVVKGHPDRVPVD